MAVVKAGRFQHVAGPQALSSFPAAEHSAMDLTAKHELLQLQVEIGALKEQLSRSHTAYTQRDNQIRAEHESALHVAYEQGVKAGVESVRIDESSRIATLQKGIGIATDTLFEHLKDIENLALDIAGAAVATVAQDPEFRASALESIIHGYMTRLGDGASLHVSVSGYDFPDARRLRESIQSPRVPLTLEVIEDAEPGFCQVKPALGIVDFSLLVQLQNLRGLFDNLKAA